MKPAKSNTIEDESKMNSLIVITGAGGFIGGHLVKYFYDKGFQHIRAVDKKPFEQWYHLFSAGENLCLDCSVEDACRLVCEGATEVYILAADMGGIGFIKRFRVECLRSLLIKTPMVQAFDLCGAQRCLDFSPPPLYT